MVDAPAVKADECEFDAWFNTFDRTDRFIRDTSKNHMREAWGAARKSSPPAQMPVVDEGMVERVCAKCPDLSKRDARIILTAALTPPSSAPASEGDKT